MANLDAIYNVYRSGSSNFPEQRVGDSQKKKAEWYKTCCDYIIALGESLRDTKKIEQQISILHGNIPEEFYRKTLNPFNANKERYKAFPATMRNLDMMKDIIRRYVSEYIKSNHQFIVGSANPDLVLKKNAKLAEEVRKYAEQAFQQEAQKKMAEVMKQQAEQQSQQQQQEPSQEGGQQPQPQQAEPQPPKIEDIMPPIEEYIANWEKNYIDDEVRQGQELLTVIDTLTDAELLYANLYFNYVAFGECYDYRDVRAGYGGNDFIKCCVPVEEAYPIPNGETFVEDHDMFARRMMMSYDQILEQFDKDLDKKDLQWIKDMYSKTNGTGSRKITYSDYASTYGDLCNVDGSVINTGEIPESYRNPNAVEVWHTVWRGYSKFGILTFQDENGMISDIRVDGSYKLNPEQGDVSITFDWETTIYESYRIGTKNVAVYPIKARPVCYSRRGKLPYNGIQELMSGFGKFSIIDLIAPYQILRNIFSYHREMMIAKNKMTILVAAKSLFGSTDEDVDAALYNMQANNALFYDDENDSNSQKAANIRLLSANLNSFINDITQLIEHLKQEARELVDMNPQRYGDINQNSGVGTTNEAIVRGSMGSVIVVYTFDKFRERSYTADMDFTKLAWVDGLDVTYIKNGEMRPFSLDVESHVCADYIIKAKNDARELDKLNQIKQIAFSMAQNGDSSIAVKAVVAENVVQIQKAIDEFEQIRQQHEEAQQQAMQEIEQKKLETQMQMINAKGEQDRMNIQAQFYADSQLEYIKQQGAVQTAAAGNDGGVGQFQTLMNKLQIEQEKHAIERAKLTVDLYNKDKDRAVKLHQIDTQYKIAKTNKNKYDK